MLAGLPLYLLKKRRQLTETLAAVDFRGFCSEELVAAFQKHDTSWCGRFLVWPHSPDLTRKWLSASLQACE